MKIATLVFGGLLLIACVVGIFAIRAGAKAEQIMKNIFDKK